LKEISMATTTARRAPRASAAAKTSKPAAKRASPARKAPVAKAPAPVKAPAPIKAPEPIKSLEPAKVTQAPKATKGPKLPKKEKLVRDSFSMPESDFKLISAVKKRALAFERVTKKSEVLRAGLKALQGLSETQLKALLETLPVIKTGRPKKAD
jgi:hypothetical protein